jgi:hypothetical protein
MYNRCGKTSELHTHTYRPTHSYTRELQCYREKNPQAYTLVHKRTAVLQGQTYRPTHSHIRDLQCYEDTPTGLHTRTYETCSVTRTNLQPYTLVHTRPAVLRGQTYRPTHSYIREVQCYKDKPTGLHIRTYENCNVTGTNLQAYTLVHTRTAVVQGQTCKRAHF